MGFWDKISNTIKAGEKILGMGADDTTDKTKSEGELAETSKIENNIDEAKALINQEGGSEKKSEPSILGKVKDVAGKVKDEAGNIASGVTDIAGNVVNDLFGDAVRRGAGKVFGEDELKKYQESQKGKSLSDTMLDNANEIITPLNEGLIKPIGSFLDLQKKRGELSHEETKIFYDTVVPEINKIEGLHLKTETDFGLKDMSFIDDYNKFNQESQILVDDANHARATKTPDEYADYIVNDYALKYDEIKNKYLSKYTDDGTVPDARQLKEMDLIVSKYNKDVSAKSLEIFPEQKDTAKKIVENVSASNVGKAYIQTLIKLGVDNPNGLRNNIRAASIVTYVANEMIGLNSFQYLSESEKQTYKDELETVAMQGAVLQAMIDAGSSEEAINKYLKSQGIDKRLSPENLKKINLGTLSIPGLLSTLGINDKVDEVLAKADHDDLIKSYKHIDSVWDINTIVSRNVGEYYSSYIAPYFDSLNLLKQGDMVKAGYYDMSAEARWADYYKRNKGVDITKKTVEVAAIATAVILTEGMSGVGLSASTAGGAGIVEGLSSFFVKSWIQDRIVEGALKANFHTMQITEQHQQLNTIFDLFGAVVDGVNVLQKGRGIEKSFNKFSSIDKGGLTQMSVGWDLSLKQKEAINKAFPAVESAIRITNKVNPDLANLMIKEKLFKKQFYRFIEKKIVPARDSMLKENGGDVVKATKQFQKEFGAYLDEFKKQADMIKDPALTINDYLEITNPVYNSNHTKPSLEDITKGKPKEVGDSVEDVINKYTSDKPTSKTKSTLNEIVDITTADDIDAIEKKVAQSLDKEDADKVTSVIKHKNANGEMVFFDGKKPNNRFKTIAGSKGIDFDKELALLLKDDAVLTLKNAANNGSELVGILTKDKIQYRKATDEEKANDVVPKFKVDGNKIVPSGATESSIIEGKKIGGKTNNVSVDLKGKTPDSIGVNGNEYVQSPLSLNVEIKTNVNNIKKIDPVKAQEVYLDYAGKVYGEEAVDVIYKNDLFVKVFKVSSAETDFQKSTKVINMFDTILKQPDSKKLLDILVETKKDTTRRFLNYINSTDPVARADFAANYKGKYSKAVKSLAGVEENEGTKIVVKNAMSDILVDNGTFNNKTKAYKFVDENYDELLSYTVANKDIMDANMLTSMKPTASTKFMKKIFKMDDKIIDPLTEFFYFNSFNSDVLNLISELSDKYKIIKSYDMPDGLRGRIKYTDNIILINGMLAKQSEAFTHEFGHWLGAMLDDSVVNKLMPLYEADKAKAIKAIKKKFKGMDNAGAANVLSYKSTFTDPKGKYFLGGEYYKAKGFEEWFAENVKEYMHGNKTRVNKEVKGVLEKFFEWLDRVIKKIFKIPNVEDEFKKVMENINDALDRTKEGVSKAEYDDLVGNIRFVDGIGKEIIQEVATSNEIKKSLADTVDSMILKYMDRNEWGLSMEFLNSVEDMIDMKTSVGSLRRSKAKAILHSYQDMYWNKEVRSVFDINDVNLSELDAFTDKEKNVGDIEHEFLLSYNKMKDVAEKYGYNRDSFNSKIRSILEEDAKKFQKNNYISEITREKLDEAINKSINSFEKHLLSSRKNEWKVNPEKINQVLGIISDADFNVPGKIYNVISTNDNSLTPLTVFVNSAAYKSREIVLPLPGDVKDITIPKNIKGKKETIEHIVKSLPNKGKSYLFVDYYTAKYWDEFTKDIKDLPDVTIVKSKINTLGFNVEGGALHLGSYNTETIRGLKDTLSSIIDINDGTYIPDQGIEFNNSIEFSDKIQKYFKDAGIENIDGSAYKLGDRDLLYYMNLANSRKSRFNNINNYIFVDSTAEINNLYKRGAILYSNNLTVDDILNSRSINEFKVNRSLLETVNNKYGFDLLDDTSIPQGELKYIKELLNKSYVAANNADQMFAQLKLLKKFMKPTVENKSLYSDLITPLFHRNILASVDTNNIAIRSTIKNLVYNDLLASGLQASISSYILRIDNVVDYLLDNTDEVEKLVDSLLTPKDGVGFVRALDEIKIPSELSAYLDNYFKLNKKHLTDYYDSKMGIINPESITKSMVETNAEEKYIAGENIFDESKNAQKGLALMFLNDKLQEVLEDTKRIKDATQFNIGEKLGKGFYVIDRGVSNYVNNITDLDLNKLINKNNFDKTLKITDKEKDVLLSRTSYALNNSLSEVKSFLKTSLQSWKKISGDSTTKYFFKKEKIDNIFGEVYVNIINYISFLKENFGGTKALNDIIVKAKQDTYGLDKFTSVTEENLEIYNKYVEDTINILETSNKDIIDELSNMGVDFDLDRLIKFGETTKLSTADVDGIGKVLVTDKYNLNEFIKEEANILGYKVTDAILDSESKTTNQFKLLGMYTEVMQKEIDKAISGRLSIGEIAESFYKNSRTGNPFRWKGHLNVRNSKYLTPQAKEFLTWGGMPKFDIYRAFDGDSKGPQHLADFFFDYGIDITDNEIHALDLSVKNVLTIMYEELIRKKLWKGTNINNTVKKLTVFSLFKGLKDTIEPLTVRKIISGVNGKNKFISEYVDNLILRINLVGETRMGNKSIDLYKMLGELREGNKKFSYIVDRYADMIRAVGNNHGDSVMQLMLDGKFGLKIRGVDTSIQTILKASNADGGVIDMLNTLKKEIETKGLITNDVLEDIVKAPRDVENLQDMVAYLDTEINNIDYDGYDFYDPFQFAKEAKAKLKEKLTPEKRYNGDFNNPDISKFIKSIVNDNAGVSKYIKDGYIDPIVDRIKSPFYNTSSSEVRSIDDATGLMGTESYTELDENILKAYKDSEDLFDNCITI